MLKDAETPPTRTPALCELLQECLNLQTSNTETLAAHFVRSHDTQSSTLERQFYPSKTTTISLVKVGEIVTQISGNDAMTFLKKI